MHLEVKVALNFIVSYLYNKLPRRRADLFGEELEKILMSRFQGHWYPEAPLRGSAFRCIHLGAPRDPVVELAAKRSGLDTEEVRANVPAELSVWIDPYEVSYQIGEKGAVKVLYLEDPPGLGCGSERAEGLIREGKGEPEAEEAKSLGFNPEAQVFVPIGSQVSPALMPSLSSSPTPLPAQPGPGLFAYPSPSTPPDPAAHSSNTSTPSPPSGGLPYLSAQQPAPALPAARPQPITFTTASFAATKFGSTKMKKCSGGGSAGGSGAVAPPAQRMLDHSPTNVSAPELLKHKPLSLSLHSLGGPIASQLSPNAKEFVYPGSPGHLYFDADTGPLQPLAGPFQPPHALNTHLSFDPFSSPSPAQSAGAIGSNGGIPYIEKPPFVEGLGSYNLQYPSQPFQPVVLAN
ncbi:protein Tob2 [Gasterosteus aculeatus]|uniref:Transducer of ERBB2, 2 n=2 Tax=Gasterosteus aculeatus TaxID=69293 RepID=A0AAQ4PCC1_GASAC|nr:protein Tob2 isoform X1 [Gasterosteus aculeatus aculeatus]XP_040045998.1 protein Tob2 isoform X1 [Gasterosteus aculeatus aculeatus]XP_040045999.1 protein Tob2 isoform X1 [Gasterosteus aculeatus aculeatus]